MNPRTAFPAAAATLAALLAALPAAPSAAGAEIVINNVDPAGSGFNDPTPAAPVGGNPGTTLGAQRLNVFQAAAERWGDALESDVAVVIQGIFTPLDCDANSAVLGAAATIQIFAEFPSAQADLWYHSALANAIAGVDLTPGPPDPGFLQPPFNDDIFAVFNSSIDGNPSCLPGDWYYGLDGLAPSGQVDLLAVVLHEFNHGLGMSGFIDIPGNFGPPGSGPDGLADVYSARLLDTSEDLHWSEMTDAQRVLSSINTGNLVWNGPEVGSRAGDVLAPRPGLTVNAPEGIAGDYEVRAASFGPTLTLGGVTADVELANDGTGTASDACEALGNSFEGRIALIDRGGCTFVEKVANAEAAGAGAVVVANNAAGLPPLGGADPGGLGIPTVGVSQADGATLNGALGQGLNVSLTLDPDLLAGADSNGLVRIYTPDPFEDGSSISHWDTSATPSLLMEPFINENLDPLNDLDLSPFQLADVGWTLVDSESDGFPDVEDVCPFSTLDPLVVLDVCLTDVANDLLIDRALRGCTVQDLAEVCEAGAGDHLDYVSCIAGLAADLGRAGVVDFHDQIQLVSCALIADLP